MESGNKPSPKTRIGSSRISELVNILRKASEASSGLLTRNEESRVSEIVNEPCKLARSSEASSDTYIDSTCASTNDNGNQVIVDGTDYVEICEKGNKFDFCKQINTRTTRSGASSTFLPLKHETSKCDLRNVRSRTRKKIAETNSNKHDVCEEQDLSKSDAAGEHNNARCAVQSRQHKVNTSKDGINQENGQPVGIVSQNSECVETTNLVIPHNGKTQIVGHLEESHMSHTSSEFNESSRHESIRKLSEDTSASVASNKCVKQIQTSLKNAQPNKSKSNFQGNTHLNITPSDKGCDEDHIVANIQKFPNQGEGKSPTLRTCSKRKVKFISNNSSSCNKSNSSAKVSSVKKHKDSRYRCDTKQCKVNKRSEQEKHSRECDGNEVAGWPPRKLNIHSKDNISNSEYSEDDTKDNLNMENPRKRKYSRNLKDANKCHVESFSENKFTSNDFGKDLAKRLKLNVESHSSHKDCNKLWKSPQIARCRIKNEVSFHSNGKQLDSKAVSKHYGCCCEEAVLHRLPRKEVTSSFSSGCCRVRRCTCQHYPDCQTTKPTFHDHTGICTPDYQQTVHCHRICSNKYDGGASLQCQFCASSYAEPEEAECGLAFATNNCYSGRSQCCGLCRCPCARSNQNKHGQLSSPEVYKCKFCDRGCCSKSNAQQYCHSQTRLRCNKCEMSCYHREHFKFCSPEKEFACQECGNNFTTSSNLKTPRFNFKKKFCSCGECSKMFSKELYIAENLKYHNESKSVSCNHCEIRFVNKSPSRENLMFDSGMNPCCCQERFIEDSQTTNHMKLNEGNGRSCTLSDNTSRSKSHLTEHSQFHSGEETHSCTQCDEPFETKPHQTEDLQFRNKVNPHSCTQCDDFTTKSHLTEHLKIHNGTNPHSCTECNKCFTTKPHLVEDLQLDNTVKPQSFTGRDNNFTIKSNLTEKLKLQDEKKPHSCTQCDKSYKTKANLTEHLKLHNETKPVSCTECDKNFTTKSRQTEHMKLHKKVKPLFCTQCDKSFTTRENLTAHLKVHNETKLHSCTQCEKSFTTKSHLTEHLKFHNEVKPYSCTQCDKSFTTRANLTAHLKVHNETKLHSCTQCEKSFTTNSHLREHLKFHNEVKPHSCTQCDKSFTTNSHLREHLKLHSGEKPYSCTQCGKSFTTKSHLRVHLNLHNGEKPHSCTQCDRSFTTKSHLRVHLNLHSGVKPHSCKQCGKSFTTKSHLTQHLKLHSGVKSYSCKYCDKKFVSNSKVNEHLRVHFGEKKFECVHCRKKFTTKSHLTCHIKGVHEKEKPPHKCDECNKSFAMKSSLIFHRMTHGGDKPHKCNICGRGYYRRQYMEKHKLIHVLHNPPISALL